MATRSVLIVGGGIAGPALAFWLLRHGFTPTIVERAPKLRTEGYIIDFWGVGYDIVEQMGLLPKVLEAGYHVNEVRLVDRTGKRKAGLDVELFRAAAGGRYTSLPRGALSAILHQAIEGRAAVRWGDSPISFEQRASGVWVEFQNGAGAHFDVVIGADGLHSVVREQVFGPTSQFETFLGFRVTAFETTGYPKRDDGIYVNYSVPGLQVGRLSLRDDRTMFLLMAAEAEAADPTQELSSTKEYLHARFGSLGWELPDILAAADACERIYSDRVSQIRMPRWYRGHVALVGDAACAPSLLAGQGAALAIIAAYVLAGELVHAVTPDGAFERYQTVLRPFILEKQAAAVQFSSTFAPRTRFGLALRNTAMRALALPGIGKLAMRNAFADDFQLPAYVD